MILPVSRLMMSWLLVYHQRPQLVRRWRVFSMSWCSRAWARAAFWSGRSMGFPFFMVGIILYYTDLLHFCVFFGGFNG